MRKKILSGILALALVLGAGAPVTEKPVSGLFSITASAESYNGFEYRIESNGNITITGYTGTATKITVPAKISGKSVTAIGSYAFSNCTGLKTVTISEGIYSIGESAFEGCTSLKTVSLPETMSSIGSFAFLSCISLTDITLPYKCYNISNFAFDSCSSLKKINIPAWCGSINGNVFNNCNSLTEITVPESHSAFSSVDGVLYTKDKTRLIKCPCSKVNVTVCEETKAIDAEAFRDNAVLTSVTLPEGLETIGKLCFYNCPSLKDLTIPRSVTEIGASSLGIYYDTAAHAPLETEGFTVYCYKDSAAHIYAISKKLDYVLLDAEAELLVRVTVASQEYAEPGEVTVEIINSENKAVKQGLSPDEKGVLSVSDLPAGSYKLKASYQSFPVSTVSFELEKSKTTELFVTLSCLGDLNADGKVNMVDYVKFQRHLLDPDYVIVYAAADFDLNGAINMRDYVKMQRLLISQ